MSEFLSGRNSMFVLLLVLLIMVASVAVKYIKMTSLTPGKVSSELDEIYGRVQDVRPMSLMKAQFLMEWGEYRDSEECSRAVASSVNFRGNGFEGDVYVVTYADSIEFPGFLPTIRKEFRITRRMAD
jgi:hypothetical protein